MKTLTTALSLILIVATHGITSAHAESFNNKSVGIAAYLDALELRPIRYNTTLYEARRDRPLYRGTVPVVATQYNDRGENPRTNLPVHRMPTSYSRFACEIATPRTFNDKHGANLKC